MRKLFAFFCVIAVSLASFDACKPEEVETKKEEKKEEEKKKDDPVTPAVKSVKISLTDENAHSASVSAIKSFSYQIKRTGADPYVFSQPLTATLDDDLQMLEFEYKCSGEVGDFQIFYAIKSAPAEASSKKYTDLKSTNEYTKYAVSITKFRDGGWGYANDCLRLDPVDVAGTDFFIRNIVIREMTDDEKQQYQEEIDKEKAKKTMAANLTAYLSATYPSEITNVTVSSDKVVVTGKTSGDGTFKLADITPWQDVTEMTEFPYVEDIAESNFTITLDRNVSGREGIIYDRVFSKWAVIKVDGGKQTLDSHARYADEVAPKCSAAKVELRNKKGFGAGDIDLYFSDCKEMNVGSITMNVTLNNVLTGTGSSINFGGKGYNIGSGKNYVDRVTSNAGQLGLVVSAIILCPTGSNFTDPECTGGYYSMPNLTTAEAFNQYAAALDFMASRYSQSNPGRISHWIMHNEVDMAKDWTNMGEQPMMRYLDRYVKSMRICYNVVRQYDQNASILGSYTHNWTQSDGGYAPKEMLEQTVAYSKAEGDFQWGVAYHPYPEDLTRPEFWKNDTHSKYTMDTPYITFKNLEVIDKWIKLEQNLYKGTTKRVLFLSENGTNSPSYSETDLKLQAAGGAWAWKKTAALDGIDAIQWHNWADNSQEFGLRIGLRSFEDGDYKGLDAKPVWYVWKAAGSDAESEEFDQYLPVIGVSSWDSIMGKM